MFPISQITGVADKCMLTINNLSELEPGNDPVLDMICDDIMGSGEFIMDEELLKKVYPDNIVVKRFLARIYRVGNRSSVIHSIQLTNTNKLKNC